ncbi:MAG: hypothetical protein ACYCYE_18515 [Clostridia bacterium]
MNQNTKSNKKENTVVIKEIMSICDELGVQFSTKVPTEKSKFLSAWNKRTTDYC